MSNFELVVPIPELAQRDEEWCRKITAVFSGGLAQASVATETWMELSANASPSEGSAYYELSDQMGTDGWRQNVSGLFLSVAYTNLPRGHRNTADHVLAVSNANLGDGTELADGRLVLIALGDVLDGQIRISAPENSAFPSAAGLVAED